MDTLRPNNLYILLYLRTSPPEPNNYHWALYHHHSSKKGGTKHHIKNEGSGWLAEHTHTANIKKEFLLVGAFRIAVLPSPSTSGEDGEGLAWIEKCMRAFDGVLNQGVDGVVFTCRVWVLRVLELLNGSQTHRLSHEDGDVDGCGHGERMLKCSDIAALEKEVMEWANGLADEADRNVQPRAVGESKLCDF